MPQAVLLDGGPAVPIRLMNVSLELILSVLLTAFLPAGSSFAAI
jgi:hypothetical protein